MTRLRDTLTLVAAIAPAACGGLNDGAYVGDPLLRIDGAIVSLSPPEPPAKTYVAIDWSENGYGGIPSTTSFTDVAPIAFPAPFSLPIFDPQPNGGITEYRGDPPGAFGDIAWGRLFVFDDVDGDGTYAAQAGSGGEEPIVDVVRGLCNDYRVLWSRDVTEPLRALMRDEARPQVTNAEMVRPGYLLARVLEDDLSAQVRIVVDADDEAVEIEDVVPPDGSEQ